MSTVLGAVEKPHCVPLGGCIGQGVCDYCGEPIRVARDRLADLIDQFVGATTPEAA